MAATLRQLIAQYELVVAGDPNLGPFDDLPLPDEERAAIQIRADQWCSSLKPNNAIEMWLLEQVCLQALRLERCQVDEAVHRDALARRAIESWDDDRRREAEQLAQKLPKSPAAIAYQLRSTRAGAAWLLQRWTELQALLDAGTPWDTAQKSRALQLLGFPNESPEALPLAPADRLVLVRSEIARLQTLHDGPLADLDHRSRAAAARGLGPAILAALAPLRRQETSIARRLEWLLSRFQSGRRPANLAPGYRKDPDGDLVYVDRSMQPAYIPPDVDPATVPPIKEPSNEPKPNPRRKPQRASSTPLPPLWNFTPAQSFNPSPPKNPNTTNFPRCDALRRDAPPATPRPVPSEVSRQHRPAWRSEDPNPPRPNL